MASSNGDSPVDRLLEAARRVERSVVGMMLTRGAGQVNEAANLGLQVEDFWDDDCRAFFAAMVKIEAAGKEVDLVSVSVEVPRAGPDNSASGPLLVELTEECPVTQNLSYFVEEVRALAAQRKAVKAIQGAYRVLLQRKPFESIEDSIDEARTSFETSVGAVAKLGPKKLEGVLSGVLKAIENRADDAAKGLTRYIPTGLKAMDFTLGGGFYPTRVYVVAGRPGTGKTAFANFVVRGAAGMGKHVAYFTLEMPAEELVERKLSNEARVSGVKLARADLSDEETDRVLHGAQSLHRLPIWYDDSFRGDVKAVIATCRRLKRIEGIDLIVMDYLQLFSMKGSKKDRVRELSDITMAIKLLAVELKVPVILLSAINRESKKAGDDLGPGLEHLKDSGSIEQDADSVIILHMKEDDRDKVWVNIPKNRGGKLKRFPIAVDFAIGAYSDININLE